MAGIAYSLKKMLDRNDLTSLFGILLTSVFITSGPWLFTTIAIGIILTVGNLFIPISVLTEFRMIITYNFSFSLVFSGLFSFIVCRDFSDKIYSGRYDMLTGVFAGSLLLQYLLAAPLVIWFYFYIAKFSFEIRLSASLNFLILLGVWHICIFLSTFREYKIISSAFLLGMICGSFSCVFLGSLNFGTAGILNAFSLGMIIISGILYGVIRQKYPQSVKAPFDFLKSYASYWEYALGGLLFNLGAWCDKWIMWLSPDSEVYPSNLICDANYSNAMFIAYLSVVPSLAYFLLSIETEFESAIMKFNSDIRNKATLSQIKAGKNEVVRVLFNCILGYVFLQGIITLASILASPSILSWLDIPMNQLGIFRYGLLGSFYQCFFILFVNILIYIDQRKAMLTVYFIFFMANAIGTKLSVIYGFQYYGLGYFAASLVTFIVSSLFVTVKINKLDYYTFIR